MEDILLGCLDRQDDPQDERDYLLCDLTEQLPLEARYVPEEYMELKERLSKVGHQNYGSCTSWGSVNGIKEFQEETDLSEYFNYVNTKKISGIYNQEGDYIKYALKAICDYGVCATSLFPDIKASTWIKYVKKEPGQEAYSDAATRKGLSYWKVGADIQSFKEAMYIYKAPVVFAMDWYSSYNQTPKDGRLPLPVNYAGGHCMAAVGWDKKGILVKNSWGEGWGNNGYFFIPYEDWSKHAIYACWVLLDVPIKEETMTNAKFVKDTKSDLVYLAYPINTPIAMESYAMNVGKEIKRNTDGSIDINSMLEGSLTLN